MMIRATPWPVNIITTKVNRRQLLRYLLASLLTLATLTLIEWLVGWRTIYQSLHRLPPTLLVTMASLSLLSQIARALRIATSLPATKRQGLVVLLSISSYHNLLNILLPMRSGEAALPLLLKQHYGISLWQSSCHLLLYRLLDLLLLMGCGALLLAISMQGGWWLAAATMLLSPLLLHPAIALLSQIIETVRWQKLQKLRHHLQQLPTRLNKSFAYLYLLTFALWLCKLLAFSLLIQQVSQLPAMAGIFAIIAGDLSSVLPSHGFAGVGSYEAAFVLAGKLFAADSTALLAAAVQLHLFMLAMAVIIWLFSQFLGKVAGKKQVVI